MLSCVLRPLLGGRSTSASTTSSRQPSTRPPSADSSTYRPRTHRASAAHSSPTRNTASSRSARRRASKRSPSRPVDWAQLRATDRLRSATPLEARVSRQPSFVRRAKKTATNNPSGGDPALVLGPRGEQCGDQQHGSARRRILPPPLDTHNPPGMSAAASDRLGQDRLMRPDRRRRDGDAVSRAATRSPTAARDRPTQHRRRPCPLGAPRRSRPHWPPNGHG